MIVAGIGARASATAAGIVSAVQDACARAGIDPADVGILAGLARMDTIAAVEAAADLLGARPEFCEIGRIRAQSARCVTHSARSIAAAGVPSVAEAAALAVAGPESMLILTRVAYRRVTVALAVGPEAETA